MKGGLPSSIDRFVAVTLVSFSSREVMGAAMACIEGVSRHWNRIGEVGLLC